MNNRLLDLPDWALDPSEGSEEGGVGSNDVEKGKPPAAVESEEDKVKGYFFAAVEQVKSQISNIEAATADIERINEQAQKATTTDKENELSKRLRKVIDGTNKQAKGAKNLLGELKTEVEDLKKKKTVKSSELRVFENLLNTLTRKFIDEMKNYQAAQQKYKTDIQNKLKRQVLVVKPDATDEEVEEIMKSEGGRDALYKQTILAGGVNDEITTVSAKVAGKYQDVKTLEQSVAELHQMFLDFALLVEQQGELLNNIEHQVRQSADHVEEANKDVYQSIEIQKKVRKKQIWIILIVIVCLIVVLFATGILP